MREHLKRVLREMGLYGPARHLYRRLASTARRERSQSRLFFRDLIEPGDLCFDVGANVGQTTEALVDCGAKVVSIEPNPLCLPVLRWQFGRDPNVTLVRKAVGAGPGTARLNFTGTASTASIRSDWPFPSDSSATVDVTTLDELIAEFGRPRLCKVDVEGFETEVFKGLSRPIPIIYFEFHLNELDRARDVLSILSKIGAITTANLTDMDHTGWLFDRWMALDEFNERLEGKAPPVGNAVLRMAT